MAASNRDRIGQMFEVLASALDQFIAGVLEPGLPEGTAWPQLVALKDSKNGITGKEYSASDPLVQLRILTENIPHQVKPGWFPFDGVLNPVQRSYASELRDVRNTWAHNGSFTDDDAYRALDTAERLLKAVNNPAAADQVAGIRRNLRRVTAERDDRRALKRAAESNPQAAGLRPWREVLQPHDDVATGNFQASEFAADLYKVATDADDLGRDYTDPVQFFARTYLTEGLRDLIGRGVRRLTGDANASPVINLQTNFGGGKTHSMLALWHLAAGVPRGQFPQEIQELLAANAYDKIPATVRRVAIVGNHLAPTGETKPDGTKVNTLWGELAWQLGGPAAYTLVADADRAGTAPGAALHDLLKRYAPAVILIDEWVAYARALVDRDDLPGGTFDAQFTFAQALTEAAKATRGVLLAISIPASNSGDDATPVPGSAEEVGGRHGQEALKRLQNVVRRVADQWRPASSGEAYHIVRQRLFVAPDAQALASIGQTARAFVDFYRKHSGEFPRETIDPAYEERIKQTYPIHPELFDRLYQDWSALERFQRTRGVLRLMNTVIHALWVGEDQSPLIMPGSIPLAVSEVNTELAQYLHDSWKVVIDTDVDGTDSEPAKIDRAKTLFGQRSLTKRLARTVFFGAAPTIGAAHKGIETRRVFLGTAIPGDVPGNFHSALTQLGDRATYFYTGSGKYWYDLQANITRRAKDQAERLHREDVWAEITRRLSGQNTHRGGFASVHVCPTDSGDIPDLDEARLVVLPPNLVHQRNSADSAATVFAYQATDHRGSGNRAHRNMVVFLAADEARMEELDSAVRDYLGWADVLDHSAELDLTENQRRQAGERAAQADNVAASRLLGTYQWALVPGAPDPSAPFVITSVKVEGQSPWLAERVTKRLGNDGMLAEQQASVAIRYQLDRIPRLWEHGHVRVADLWAVYADYPYMPRLRDRQVLHDGVAAGQSIVWDHDGFALATGYDSDTGRYQGLTLPTDPVQIPVTGDVLLVKPGPARQQRDHDQATAPDPAATGGASSSGDTSTTGTGAHPMPAGTGASGNHTPPQGPGKTRFFATTQLKPDLYARDFKKVADEVIDHLVSDPDVTLQIRIEIEATNQAGFDDATIRTLSENAHTLKFEQSGFEEQ